MEQKKQAARKSEPLPLQPLVLDDDGAVRFRANKIVRLLLDGGPFDMNMLAMMEFSPEDRCQFAQLIGYSLNGYSELSSYVSDAEWNRAVRAQKAFLRKASLRKSGGTK